MYILNLFVLGLLHLAVHTLARESHCITTQIISKKGVSEFYWLVKSIRTLRSSFRMTPIHVVTPNMHIHTILKSDHFNSLNITIHIVRIPLSYSKLNRWSSKLLSLNPFITPDHECESIIYLDTDTIILKDPRPYLKNSDVQMRTVDHTFNYENFKSNFKTFGALYGLSNVKNCENTLRINTKCFSQFNGGVLIIRQTHVKEFVQKMEYLYTSIADGKNNIFGKFDDQTIIPIAFSLLNITVQNLPGGMNLCGLCVLKMREQMKSNVDPVILHHHMCRGVPTIEKCGKSIQTLLNIKIPINNINFISNNNIFKESASVLF